MMMMMESPDYGLKNDLMKVRMRVMEEMKTTFEHEQSSGACGV